MHEKIYLNSGVAKKESNGRDKRKTKLYDSIKSFSVIFSIVFIQTCKFFIYNHSTHNIGIRNNGEYP